jgi:hypothetical protein
MSKLMDPLSFLRKSPTGAKIVGEVEAGDDAVERRKVAAKTVADIDAKLNAAQDAVRKAAADEREKIAAAKIAFTNTVNAARKASSDARSKAHSLQHERDNAERHLRSTADPRIAEFKADTWARFQSRRGSMAHLSEEFDTNKRNPRTNEPIVGVRTNSKALNRWVATVTSVMSKAEAMKLECLTENEVSERLASLQAEVVAAEKATGEMQDAGERPGDALSDAVQNAAVISRGPKQSRYQLVDAE